MEPEIIETVMSEVLSELRELKQQQTQQTKAVVILLDKLQNFENKVSDIKVQSSSPIDINSLSKDISDGITSIKSVIETQPKSVIKQYRFLLFPEQNAGEYYRIVIGRLLFWVMVFLLATYLFALTRQFIDNWAIVRNNELNGNQYKKAWQYLYKNENKSGKRKMDSGWYKAYN
jgi:hypothetical protein